MLQYYENPRGLEALEYPFAFLNFQTEKHWKNIMKNMVSNALGLRKFRQLLL
jgi:hypothetical protein